MDTLKLVKTLEGDPREYTEFLINDKPPLYYFREVYEYWKDIDANVVLDESMIGVLNSVHSLEGQALQIKAFLREKVTVAECQQILPHTTAWSLADIEVLLEEDFNNEKVMLYCCRTCGDRYCPGLAVRVTIEDQYFVWSFDEEYRLQFRFDQQQYRKVFITYLRELNKSC